MPKGLETKTVSARIVDVKADGAQGTAVALVSVFGNVDLGGDRVMPGAFDNTIKAWRDKGDPIPVVWSHNWDDPAAFVGEADPNAVEATDAGLVVPMKFDMDRPFAEQVHHLLKSRRVTQFSFGYFAKDYTTVEDPQYGEVRELKEIELFEVGPTLLGMNPATELLEAASAISGSKAGRVLSSKNEGLIRDAHGALGEVLSALGEADAPKSASAKALDESAHPVTSRQVAVYRALEDVVETFGQFDQTTGPDGSHYVASAANPFIAEGMVCASCVFYEGPRSCEIVSGDIDPQGICKFWQIPADLMGAAPEDGAKSAQSKAIEVPSYVSENAARGLAYYEDGLGGDGLVEQTISDARDMAAGSISDAKVRDMGPWIARHIVDLEAPQNSDPEADGYPGAGLVAMLLWGAGPDVEGARRTQAWAEETAANLEETASATDEATAETPADDAGDRASMIDHERLTDLLVRPRHMEESNE